jgi:hypothetical protein
MASRDLTYDAWQARRSENRRRRRLIEAGLPAFRRERLRRADEAAFLRRIGTPEDLIGPVASDAEVDRAQEDLVLFARRMRKRGSTPLS